jgi:cytochrome P450
MINPLHWPNIIYNHTSNGREEKRNIEIVNNFSRDVILQREADLVANNFVIPKRHSFIDIFLKAKHDQHTNNTHNNNKITIQSIQNEVNSFVFAGHDTTSVAASWACQLIGSHPDVQKKLHDEIDSVLGTYIY